MRYHTDSGLHLFSSDERLEVLDKIGDPLRRLGEHIDFEFFRPTLEGALYLSHNSRKGGRPPFDPVLMFKVLVIQRLYNLSDDSTEYLINDRLSFMRFLGLDLGGRVPDAKTIWVFRERLKKEGLVKKLFEELTCHLERERIIANSGQLVDATIVPAPRQRNSRSENETIKSGETPPEWQDELRKQSQKDVDARWTMKNSVTYYGYKNHIICDRKSKLIKGYVVTDASVHDSQVISELTDNGRAHGQTLYADSAYRSAGIETNLAGKTIKSRIHLKAARNKPLTKKQQASNRARSRQRSRVEHVFGFMENSMGGIYVRCCSKVRNEVVIGLLNLTYNLCRIRQLSRTLEHSPA